MINHKISYFNFQFIHKKFCKTFFIFPVIAVAPSLVMLLSFLVCILNLAKTFLTSPATIFCPAVVPFIRHISKSTAITSKLFVTPLIIKYESSTVTCISTLITSNTVNVTLTYFLFKSILNIMKKIFDTPCNCCDEKDLYFQANLISEHILSTNIPMHSDKFVKEYVASKCLYGFLMPLVLSGDKIAVTFVKLNMKKQCKGLHSLSSLVSPSETNVFSFLTPKFSVCINRSQNIIFVFSIQ